MSKKYKISETLSPRRTLVVTQYEISTVVKTERTTKYFTTTQNVNYHNIQVVLYHVVLVDKCYNLILRDC